MPWYALLACAGHVKAVPMMLLQAISGNSNSFSNSFMASACIAAHQRICCWHPVVPEVNQTAQQQHQHVLHQVHTWSQLCLACQPTSSTME